MKRKTSSKPRPIEQYTPEEPADAETPPGQQKRGDENTARYLITDYDTPLDPKSEEHTEYLLALYWAANLLRKKAMRWRDDIDWAGTSHQQSEEDIEARFRRADQCDREARLLLDEYRRGARREWIAYFPRKGPQYRKEVYEGWKRQERRHARKAVKAARS